MVLSSRTAAHVPDDRGPDMSTCFRHPWSQRHTTGRPDHAAAI